MDNELPNEFDIIVVGTGMIESIIAAAASRIGKRVLHIDSNDYYGGVWASFNLEGIEKYVFPPKKSINDNQEKVSINLTQGEERLVNTGNNLFGISNVSQKWYIPKELVKEAPDVKAEGDGKEEEDATSTGVNETNAESCKSEVVEEGWTQEKVLKDCRKFNLDLAPKLQFARGDFVELLISSNIARYSEYRSVSRVLTWLNGQLEGVPCSRSDVFSNSHVSVVEKRMLMKLLSMCMDGDETQFADYHNKTFYAFLKDKKLTSNLIHYVLYAISMSDEKTPCLDGVESTKRFLNSLGRFGKTPFLFSMYGSGELPQAFCRLCAVFGGTYCLNRPVSSLVFDAPGKCLGIICDNKRINAENFVVSIDYVPEKISATWKREKISRVIFITDRSILPCDKENLTLLLFPPEDGKTSVTVIELGPSTGTCPPGLYLIHMYCKQTENPENDFEHCAKKLLNFSGNTGEPKSSLPTVLWSLYFTVTNADINSDKDLVSENVYVCSGPDLDLDYDGAVKKAKEIFAKMYPDSEFLPRAPDPEEIILCDDEPETQNLETEKVESDVETKDQITQE